MVVWQFIVFLTILYYGWLPPTNSHHSQAKSFLEENGELLSANIPSLLSVQSSLPNKEQNFQVAFFKRKKMCSEASYSEHEVEN